jgi:hypothetical protein
MSFIGYVSNLPPGQDPKWTDMLPGHAPEFRDELLLLNPGLLNFFLTKANSSRQGFENVSSEACDNVHN